MKKNFPTRRAVSIISVTCLSVGILTLALTGGTREESGQASKPAIEPQTTQRQPAFVASEPAPLGRNSTVYEALRSAGFSPIEIHEITRTAKPHHNLSRVRPGTQFTIYREATAVAESTDAPEAQDSHGSDRRPAGVRFDFSATQSLEITRGETNEWAAKLIEKPVEIQLVTYTGLVETSLWESAHASGMDPELISELSEVFAWQVDFSREVRRGDRWRLTVERRLVEGNAIGWGRVVAAEYENAGQVYTGVLFRKDSREVGYFSPDGQSLRKMFLKSPIRFGRISSRFRRQRFHPILRRNRPHLGVDYAAPTGTPIRAVGNGTVTLVGYRGGGGKTIRIRHNSVYQTAYKHLNGYAPGIRSGAKVRQGQVIGYVGSTGLSTGPHLHFEFYENGRFVDPLGRKFPSADPVPRNQLADFQAEADRMLATLPPWYRPGVTLGGPVEVLLADASDATVPMSADPTAQE